jgi:phenylacetic acid degradation operon negative regulatory protein
VKPKTEEFLNFLLWNADRLMRPTYHNLFESYEGWAYRNGLLRQIPRLKQRGFLECDRADVRICRLTREGRLHTIGGRDPEVCWAEPWDGCWRIAVFDVSTKKNRERDRLRRYLRHQGYGCLQQSVWITPRPLTGEVRHLLNDAIDADSLVFLKGSPCAGESDRDLVASAWSFPRINAEYQAYQRFLDRFEIGTREVENSEERVRHWATAEQKAWLRAVGQDPLLPEQLLPTEYEGKRAWRRRMAILRRSGVLLKQLKS